MLLRLSPSIRSICALSTSCYHLRNLLPCSAHLSKNGCSFTATRSHTTDFGSIFAILHACRHRYREPALIHEAVLSLMPDSLSRTLYSLPLLWLLWWRVLSSQLPGIEVGGRTFSLPFCWLWLWFTHNCCPCFCHYSAAASGS